MPRATAILAAMALALAACGREGPEDPAVAAPGAGIPIGAVGAVGASFDAPTARPDPAPVPVPKGKHGKPKGLGPTDPPPPDPFASPPDEPEPAPAPKPKGPRGPKTHSPSETTL